MKITTLPQLLSMSIRKECGVCGLLSIILGIEIADQAHFDSDDNLFLLFSDNDVIHYYSMASMCE
ncbi:MAG: hypothetical protein ACUVRK_04335 [Spirochaetota bacterium]